jgi:cell wall-associated NlpC family hydrolase
MPKKTLRRHAATLLTAVVTLTGAMALAPAPAASAAPISTFSPALGRVAVAIAAQQKGRPYVWGAATPRRGFDCSGLVSYVYRARLHRSLGRSVDQQYRQSIRVSHRAMRPGDLVFFMSHGHAYHVGIYAGRNRIWHAPHTGARVRLAVIWTTQWVGGRVR